MDVEKSGSQTNGHEEVRFPDLRTAIREEIRFPDLQTAIHEEVRFLDLLTIVLEKETYWTSASINHTFQT